MDEIASKTGGLNFLTSTLSGAVDAAAQTGRVLRHQNVIGYYVPVANHSGKWHKIRVLVNLPKARVYARKGYYAHFGITPSSY
jgi:hypothetical protein